MTKTLVDNNLQANIIDYENTPQALTPLEKSA